MSKLVFEFEYQREAPISLFYVWYIGHYHACAELLGMDAEPAKKVFSIYEEGVWKAYTQENNIGKIKESINSLDQKKLEKIIDTYIDDYKKFNLDNSLVFDKEFIKKLIGGFVVMFITGDMSDHELQAKALKAREGTEKIFYEIWQALKSDFKKESFELYSYDEILDGDTPVNIEGNLRKKSILISECIMPVKNLEELGVYLNNQGIALKENDDEKVNQILGSSAYVGKEIGSVCIVLNRQMFDKFSEGDILVTSMTTPDYLPIMKKASAFITDEGGITCHAAIVARELRKPCIIGTKIATQVLKDGDQVEVDADRGIVTILKKVDE